MSKSMISSGAHVESEPCQTQKTSLGSVSQATVEEARASPTVQEDAQSNARRGAPAEAWAGFHSQA